VPAEIGGRHARSQADNPGPIAVLALDSCVCQEGRRPPDARGRRACRGASGNPGPGAAETAVRRGDESSPSGAIQCGGCRNSRPSRSDAVAQRELEFGGHAWCGSSERRDHDGTDALGDWTPGRHPYRPITAVGRPSRWSCYWRRKSGLNPLAGFSQVRDDAVGAALGDAQCGGDVAWAHPGSWATHSTARAWLVRKLHSATSGKSSRIFIEIDC
jgi:hypothetical protein